MVEVLAPPDRETKIHLISFSISKILSLNLSRELCTLSSLVLRLDKSSINEDMCGTIEKSKEGSEKESMEPDDTTTAAAPARGFATETGETTEEIDLGTTTAK